MSKKTHVPDDRPNQGLSRRELFRTAGLATGGAMLLGLPNFLSGLGTTAEAALSSSMMEIVLANKMGGPLVSFSGGAAFADILLEPEETDVFLRKRPGPVRFDDIVLEIKLESIWPVLSNWITQSLSLTKYPVLMNGAITQATVGRLEFFNAVLSEVTVNPGLVNQDIIDAYLRLRITPQSTLFVPSWQLAHIGNARAAAHTLSFKIQGLESASHHIKTISPFTVRRTAAQKFDCSVVSIELPHPEADPFYEWFDTMVIKGKADAQRAGLLEWRDSTNKVVGSIQLGGLGIVRHRLTVFQNNQPHMAVIEMYCETINFKLPM